MTTMQEVFDEHAGIALSRQRDLAAKIGTWRWDYDGDAGTMTFTKPGWLGFGKQRIATRCAVLGSESESAGTWLWSWANTHLDLAPEVLEAAEALRARGQREGIAELTAPSLPLDAWDGHAIAMIASGTRDCAGYYRGPYDGGALFVLLTGPELVTPVERPLLRFAQVLPELIASAPVQDHRRAARGLARGLGLRCTEAGVWQVAGDGGAVAVHFDELGRLARVEGELR